MSQRITKRAKANAALKSATPVEAKEAVATLKKFKAPKFDQTVNICMHLGVDPAQADQNLRGAISLPRGIGKAKRVVAFCQSDVAPKAMEAGAIKAGGEELVAEIEKGWMDFDVAVASPDMMRVVSKLGKVLGPKGLMPSPKAGTVTTNIPQAVKEYAAGKVEYRTDKGGNVHAVIGKMSFAEDALEENLSYFVSAIEKAKPSTVKGIYIKKVTVSGAMTPGVQVKYVAKDAVAE
ncbi:MAG: 50S ribosomal protein L1 [Phycisphaerales bacterium]|nr:50S ribosomal protein L1 [Phycisphaerales bacterium]